MSDSCLELSNLQARNIWLERQGLSTPPCGRRQIYALAERVASLGMVQLDSIGVLARAHHHILWSRQSAYRQRHYNTLLTDRRLVFEHFSHDAVILPISCYPWWQRQHQRRAARHARNVWGERGVPVHLEQALLEHVDLHGAVCSRDLASFQSGPVDRSKHAWNRPQHKHCLDYLWLKGRLSVSHRQDFTKYYDLSERIIPQSLRENRIDERSQIDWLCEQALSRLGFATAGEIQRFWEACEPSEVQAWLKRSKTALIPVRYADCKGAMHSAHALADKEEQLRQCPRPTSRLRILNPFDPLVRDRQRLQRLFGFDYRIEIYVPPAQRRFGYYVYPLLEGTRFVGRIEVRANRQSDRLDILAWWLEPGQRETAARRQAIERELRRLCALADVSQSGPLPQASPIPAER